MQTAAPTRLLSAVLTAMAMIFSSAIASSQQATFRHAPASSTEMKSPYAGSASAVAAGKTLYGKSCAQCHGANRQGMGPAPALDSTVVRNAKPGELFWFISNGKPSSGMPAWSNLSKQQRWQLVTFLQSSAK